MEKLFIEIVKSLKVIIITTIREYIIWINNSC